MKYIPNILTVFRFLLVPLIVITAVQNNYISTIIILTISGITDILDGFIARKFNFISDFGKLMDPLADKITQISLLLTITLKRIIPFWISIIVILKEVLMVTGASFLYGKQLVVSSKWYGKLSTVLFYIAFVLSLFLKQFESNLLLGKSINEGMKKIILFIDQPFYYLALIATIFSLLMYIKAFSIKKYLNNKV